MLDMKSPLNPQEISSNSEFNGTLARRNNTYQKIKRVLDVLVTLTCAPIIVALLLVVVLIQLITMGTPIVFRQQRMGKDGVPFTMYKLRSMKSDAESAGASFAQANDSRVTAFGAVMRRFRIDELPQFWNVLKGDMSIVGPRPEQVEFAIGFSDALIDYDLRHSVRPGLTGLAQVSQGYAANEAETKENYSTILPMYGSAHLHSTF